MILVENVFRNCQGSPEDGRRCSITLPRSAGAATPPRSTGGDRQHWTERLRLILISALEVDKAVFFSAAITVAAFVPLFTMQGVEGQIFNPMARTYGFALAGALLATFTITPVLASFLLPAHIEEVETIVVRGLRAVYSPALHWALTHRKSCVGAGRRLSGR